MTNYEINLCNLKALVAELGSAAAVAEAAGTSENHLNQILRGEKLASGNPRGIGPALARKLEKGCNKHEGWMDQDHSQNNMPPEDAAFLNELRKDVAIYDIPPHIKQTILTLITSSPKKT